MEKLTAVLRVTALKVIAPFAYKDGNGEALEMRSSGTWKDEEGNEYPVSLHTTAYPGCGVVPCIGDHVKITIERS